MFIELKFEESNVSALKGKKTMRQTIESKPSEENGMIGPYSLYRMPSASALPRQYEVIIPI